MGFGLRPRLFLLALLAALLVQGLSSAPGAAASSTSVHLSGRVPPRASLWIARLASSFSFIRRAYAETGRVRLTELDLSANNRQFSISLISRNSGRTGVAALVDPSTQAVVPYRLTLAGAPVTFVDGEARLRMVQDTDGDKGPKPLDIEIPPNMSGDDGSYEEQLVVVVKAR